MFIPLKKTRRNWHLPWCGVLLALGGCGRIGFDLQDALDPPQGDSKCSVLCDGGDASAPAEPDAATLPDGTDSGAPQADAGDAGNASGGRPADASVADAASVPPCNRGLFCSGFENPTLEDWDRRLTLNGTAEQGTSTVYEGKGAFSASAAPPNGAAVVSKSGFGPISSGSFHARAYYFVPSSAAGLSFALMTTAPTPLLMQDGVSLLASADSFGLTVNSDQGATLHAAQTAMPYDRWFCLELELQLSNTQGVATIRLDGVAEQIETGIDTLPSGGVDDVSVGIALVQPSATRIQVLVDDFVVDTSPIGCD